MQPIRISVLMPVYNGMPYLAEAVGSVLAQDEKDWELVISDNGSTDGSLDYLDSLLDPRIRVFRQHQNLGIFGNLNFLLAEARAEVAKILCSDDSFLLSVSLGRIAKFMEDRPWCAVSRCLGKGDFSRYFESGRQWRFEAKLPTRIFPEASLLAFATFGNIVGNLTKAACRPKQVLEAGGFDQAYPYAAITRGGCGLPQAMAFRFRTRSSCSSGNMRRKTKIY